MKTKANESQIVMAWCEKHYETLKSLFADYCSDTGTQNTDINFVGFATGMFKQCRH